MRIACVSDIHVGNHKRHGGKVDAGMNTRCCLILAAFDEAIAVAKREKCGVLLVAGDFLDYVRMEPQIIALLQTTIKQAGLDIVLVLGDHEIVTNEKGDHALGPLAPVAHVIDEPKLMRLSNVELACVPFQPGSSEKLVAKAASDLFSSSVDSSRARALAFHAGITHSGTPKFLRDAPDSIKLDTLKRLVEKLKLDFVVAGNFHFHERWQHNNCEIIQIGALVPTGYDNPGLTGYGKLAVFDPDERSVKLHQISGPRFVQASIDDDELIEKAKEYLGPVYLQITAESDRMTEAQGYRKELLDDKHVSEVEVVPDKKTAEKSACNAATAAREQNTLEAALAAFIDKMEVEEGLDRKQIYHKAKEYLTKGKVGK